MAQHFGNAFQNVHKEDVLQILVVALELTVIGHKAVSARSTVAGKHAV